MRDTPSCRPTADDEPAGYRITTGTQKESIRIRCWGYWGEETASSFERDAVAAVRESPNLQSVALDAEELKTQGKAGQAALRGLMRQLTSMPPRSCTADSTNALTKMQLRRLARECGLELMEDPDG